VKKLSVLFSGRNTQGCVNSERRVCGLEQKESDIIQPTADYTPTIVVAAHWCSIAGRRSCASVTPVIKS
jgi:hypothetical protein